MDNRPTSARGALDLVNEEEIIEEEEPERPLFSGRASTSYGIGPSRSRPDSSDDAVDMDREIQRTPYPDQQLPMERPITRGNTLNFRPQTKGDSESSITRGNFNSDRPTTRPSRDMERPPTRSMQDVSRPATRGEMDRPLTRGSGYDREELTSGRQAGSSRPITSGRPRTSRPISAALRNAPSTASRLLSSAALQRPGTRTGMATGIGLTTPVQDKTYFMGLLRGKISDLGNEINHLSQEIRRMQDEQSTFLTYDKRVKEMAKELIELQGTLADFNLLVDLINTDREKSEADEERENLKRQNDEQNLKMENLFSKKQDIEKAVRDLTYQIEEERQIGYKLVEGMDYPLRNRYEELRNTNLSLVQNMEVLQQDIDTLDSRIVVLEDELSVSKIKQEAVVLYEKMRELEEKKQEMEEENTKRGTPKEERERLLQQVKNDNAEIATMERQTSELQDEIRRTQEDLQQIEQELEENQSERSQKYRELRKREEAMEQFLQTFGETKEEELRKIEELESNNVLLMERVSRNLSHFGHLPSSKDFDSMQTDLNFKQGELEKSKFTETGLRQEHLNLQGNLQKIEALEVKVTKEMEDLKVKLAEMEKEMEELSDIDGLKHKAEEKRKTLINEKEELEKQSKSISQSLKEVTDEFNAVKAQLMKNETYVQLNNLEKKWSHLEQNNFSIREIIAQKKAESNFLPLKNQAMKLVMEYHKVLQEVVQSGGIRS